MPIVSYGWRGQPVLLFPTAAADFLENERFWLIKAVEPLQNWILAKSALARRLEQRDDPLAELPMTTDEKYLSRQVVLVGYGRVGKRIASALMAHNLPFVVAEQNREIVEQLRAQGLAAVSGDASEPAVLIQAHIARARMLVIATPETVQVRAMADIARTLNPQIQVIVRSHNAQEAALLEADGTATVFVGETELGRAMVRHVLQWVDKPHATTEPQD